MFGFALALAHALGVDVGDAQTPKQDAAAGKWLSAVADDLRSRRPGATLVLAGDGQPARVHALVLAINDKLGNVGKTVVPRAPLVQETPGLPELTADMARGDVAMLVMLGGNPLYNAPADLKFADALSHVPFRVHLSSHEDETSAECHWHIPLAHFLESWGDARAFDGTVSFVQPTIAPLYQGKTAEEVLAAMLEGAGRTAHDLVRETWQTRHGKEGFEAYWQRGLHDGVVPGTEAAAMEVTLDSDAIRRVLTEQTASPPDKSGMEIVFRPDPSLWDGRYANNGWLQELPRPITTLTWDNAALIAPATAERLKLANEDVVEIRSGKRILEIPVWIVPGHAEDSLTVHLGHGRKRAGTVGNGSGFNAFQIQTSEAPGFVQGASVRKTGRTFPLAVTQHHHLMHGRDLMRVGTPEELRADPEHPAFMQTERHEPRPGEALTLYDDSEHYNADQNAWAMNINLNACIGCSACVVACQSENNIPIVGKEEVIRGREMHWIRVDSYFEGDPANPAIYHQPVPCMQCEHAPCEIVCPVGATVHSDEGLNDMVYNRCVGTRYCSNNCPYKVRRFNFLTYNDFDTESLKLMRNPDVTVRAQGVMEKCTYCVQRISAARIEAEKEDRAVRDGEIVTACQAACPTEAIVFGNRNDEQSRVRALSRSPLNYAMMEELNTRPRTTYLAALRNPNPALERTANHDRSS
jgi:molybdopterin-containing oxidoreductase family iron-sulfur binding subunit